MLLPSCNSQAASTAKPGLARVTVGREAWPSGRSGPGGGSARMREDAELLPLLTTAQRGGPRLVAPLPGREYIEPRRSCHDAGMCVSRQPSGARAA